MWLVGDTTSKETLIWAPPGLQELVCVKIQEAGLQFYNRTWTPPVCQVLNHDDAKVKIASVHSDF